MNTIEILKDILINRQDYIHNLANRIKVLETQITELEKSMLLADEERKDIDDSIMRLEDNS